jgi:hypothetical protein
MFYLIDGYNLLHAMGAMRSRMGPAGLERARGRLLGLLRGALGEEAHHVTVVFDAAHAPPGAAPQQEHHGIHVRFASREGEADDLIEELIRQASAPKQLAVVSDDHRLQKAAQRRRCTVLGCDAFLHSLQRRRRPTPRAPGEAAKPEGVSRRETQHWLKEFADLADDPAVKELFDPFDFDERS